MSLVWSRLDVQGGELTLALSLADFANDSGESIWPSVATLQFKTRQGERTVRRQLARFREIGWLEIVKPGGGAGSPTVYRINAEWIKGANLAGLPDLKPREFAEEKGADLAGNPKLPCHLEPKTLPNGAKNPAIAVAPNPSESINKPLSDGTRASPTGSRPPQTPEEIERRDIAERTLRASWSSWVMSSLFNLAWHYDAGKRGATSWADLITEARAVMQPKVAEIVDRAIAWANDIPPRSKTVIENMIADELVSELKRFKSATPAERAAAHADAA